MQELVLVVHCDSPACEAQEVTKHSLTVDGRSWDVDLCPEHGEPLGPLLGLLEELGRPAGRGTPPRKGPGTGPPSWEGALAMKDAQLYVQFRTCPKCGAESRTRQGLSAHVRQHHDTTLTSLERGAGTDMVCPRCGEGFDTFNRLSRHSRETGHPLSGEEGRGGKR